MSSRRPLRTSLLNSSGVKGRLGSSSIGLRIRGPKNHRTRLASRRMSIPSRQQQTFESAYCSSCRMEIARGRKKAARKISWGIVSPASPRQSANPTQHTSSSLLSQSERTAFAAKPSSDSPSRRRSTAHVAARLDPRFEFHLKISHCNCNMRVVADATREIYAGPQARPRTREDPIMAAPLDPVIAEIICAGAGGRRRPGQAS